MANQELKPAVVWDEVRQLADDIKVQLHLGSMEARTRWEQLQPQLHELERTVTDAGQRASEAITERLQSVAATLRKLRDDLRK